LLKIDNLIGSFDVEDLLEWYSRAKHHSHWKIESHSLILWPNKDNPYVYKSANMLHGDTITDLMNKVPDSFCLITLHECLTAYGRGRNIHRNFPSEPKFDFNDEVTDFIIETKKDLRFRISKKHVSNETFFSFNDYGRDGTYESVHETLTVDFENKKLISSIIDVEENVQEADYHLLSGQ